MRSKAQPLTGFGLRRRRLAGEPGRRSARWALEGMGRKAGMQRRGGRTEETRRGACPGCADGQRTPVVAELRGRIDWRDRDRRGLGTGAAGTRGSRGLPACRAVDRGERAIQDRQPIHGARRAGRRSPGMSAASAGFRRDQRVRGRQQESCRDPRTANDPAERQIHGTHGALATGTGRGRSSDDALMIAGRSPPGRSSTAAGHSWNSILAIYPPARGIARRLCGRRSGWDGAGVAVAVAVAIAVVRERDRCDASAGNEAMSCFSVKWMR